MRRVTHVLVPAAISLMAFSACGSNAGESGAARASGSGSAITAGAPITSGAGAASTSGATSPGPAGASTAPTVAATTEAIPQLLQFSAPLVGGGQFDGAAYAGKPLALWFWGPT